jgi:hypothetical protein
MKDSTISYLLGLIASNVLSLMIWWYHGMFYVFLYMLFMFAILCYTGAEIAKSKGN